MAVYSSDFVPPAKAIFNQKIYFGIRVKSMKKPLEHVAPQSKSGADEKKNKIFHCFF
jgi:hypothetical protein